MYLNDTYSNSSSGYIVGMEVSIFSGTLFSDSFIYINPTNKIKTIIAFKMRIDCFVGVYAENLNITLFA